MVRIWCPKRAGLDNTTFSISILFTHVYLMCCPSLFFLKWSSFFLESIWNTSTVRVWEYRIKLTVSENALLGLLAGVPFIFGTPFHKIYKKQQKQPTNPVAQNFFTDTCWVNCQTSKRWLRRAVFSDQNWSNIAGT